MTTSRLDNEIQLLLRAEFHYGIRALPVLRQLIAWEDTPLPDRFPLQFQWTRFQWPVSGEVDFTGYWRELDRGRR